MNASQPNASLPDAGGAKKGSSAPVHHSWVVVDSVDPNRGWRLSFPRASLSELLKTIYVAGESSELLVMTSSTIASASFSGQENNRAWAAARVRDDPLVPTLDDLDDNNVQFAGKIAGFTANGDKRDEWTTDLGAYLVAGEPQLDVAYRRHFCASRPPLAIFTDDDDDNSAERTLIIATWSDVFQTRPGTSPEEAMADKINQQRLRAFIDDVKTATVNAGGTCSSF